MAEQITGMVTGATLGLLIGMFLMFLGMKKQLARLAHVDAKVNLLMEHAGIKFGPLATMPREAADALKRSDKIEAIRLYRANTGASLVEAKQVVEAAHA